MSTIEEYRKIEITINRVFTYNFFQGDEILLKQILDEINLYLKWVDSLKVKYKIRKEHSIEHIAEQIFSETITKNNFKYHIEAFCISLIAVKEDLNSICEADDDENKIKVKDCSYIKGILALLKDLILDFNEIYWQIEEVFFNNPQDTKSGRRRMFMGREIFKSSKDILKRQVSYGEISYSSVSIFLLRQSIEITILRALGIYSFVDDKNKEQKVKLDKLLCFIKDNKKYIKFPVKTSILKKIIKWSNPYVHKAIMHLHWQIIISQKTLLPLFVGGEDKQTMSIHGAIQINMDFYQNNLESELIKHLGLKNNVRTIRIENPDCLLTKNIFEW